MLNGTIPGNIGKLSKLKELDLSLNSLMGALIESHFTDLVNLEYMDFSYNSLFEGSLLELDPTNFLGIYLNNNSFSGSNGIHVVSLSDNHISGNIPSFICNLTTMELFDVSNNNMSGTLPNCWNSGLALHIIHLSDNNLTGKILDALVSFTNLQSFVHFELLGLSECITQQFVWKIPTGTQLQPFDPSLYKWNHGLYGLSLLNCANKTNPPVENEEEGKGDCVGGNGSLRNREEEIRKKIVHKSSRHGKHFSFRINSPPPNFKPWMQNGLKANAINSDAMVEAAIHVCFFDTQEIAPPPSV
ncbi:receptor-like protein 38 [Dioscorea cayenensis subsp. rotundata]|uniref:Receptor-like protein 38 n=1 Tax=Dioscorea cayennensis subsp. rotundata TaxID=55577 RepID=A0AB40B3D4_DIOCR|nr:receptor-like protein 38 [Dioscorea cayenensis subsp. rotundata]